MKVSRIEIEKIASKKISTLKKKSYFYGPLSKNEAI
jgi:hypothetical protein